MSELLSTPKQHVARTPKKFLKKGEGLKRFAAYNPPLPKVTAKKIRQTFVKFDLENKYAEDRRSYLPDILLDDSKNLSMEVPPIPRPKIVHTPMRPTKNQQTPMKQSTRVQQTPLRQPRVQQTPIKLPTIKAFKTPTKEHSVIQVNQNTNNNPNDNINNNNNINKNTKKGGKNGKRYNLRSRRQDDVIEQQVTPDLSSPSPGNCILALAKQIQQVESSLNELKIKIENCNCGSEPVRTTRRGQATKKENQPRHPATAVVSTPKILKGLVDDISQLKKSFDDLQVAR